MTANVLTMCLFLCRYIVENVLQRCGNVHGWWIGLTEQDTSEGRKFVWSDGVNAEDAFQNWSQHQPDNSGNCAVIAQYFQYRWDDVPCVGPTNGVLCERYLGFVENF